MRRSLATLLHNNISHKSHITSTPLLSFSSIPPNKPHMSTATHHRRSTTTTKKVIVIMGPTGCGKSKLSIDISTRTIIPAAQHSFEIINSDKIQIYKGLNITTNKIPIQDRKNIPHHLIDHFNPSLSHPIFTPFDFRSSASKTISQIHSRRHTPLIVGGSNSFIHSLLTKTYNPNIDIFNNTTDSISPNNGPVVPLRYKCCFIWVDVSLPVLNNYLNKRVDEMLDSGMLDELKEYYFDNIMSSGSKKVVPKSSGLNKAIGVPEFEKYFKFLSCDDNDNDDVEEEKDNKKKKILRLYEEGVKGVKDNTCQLAKRQLGKILRLRDGLGWDIKRVDATAALRAAMEGDDVAAEEVWEREVVGPSMKIVKQFLMST